MQPRRTSRRLLKSAQPSLLILFILTIHPFRLRQVDVKAEHFERQVQRAEQERDAWEKKYEVCCLLPSKSRSIN